MIEVTKCNVTVIGFGARGAESISALENSFLSCVRYEVIDAKSAAYDAAALASGEHICQRFSGVDLLILLIDDLSSTEMRIALELASMEIGAPYLLIAIAPNPSDADLFKTELEKNPNAKVGALLCLQSAGNSEVGRATALDAEGASDLNFLLCHAIHGITDLLLKRGVACVDLSDVRCAFSGSGLVHVGFACSDAGNNQQLLIQQAIHNMPDGLSRVGNARGVVACIYTGDDIRLDQFSDIADLLEEHLPADCLFIIGARTEPSVGNNFKLCLYVQ